MRVMLSLFIMPSWYVWCSLSMGWIVNEGMRA